MKFTKLDLTYHRPATPPSIETFNDLLTHLRPKACFPANRFRILDPVTNQICHVTIGANA